MNKKPCIRECVNTIFDRLKDGEQFSGLELKSWVVLLNDDYTHTFPDTILREARRNHRSEFRKLNPRKSIYVVTKR